MQGTAALGVERYRALSQSMWMDRKRSVRALRTAIRTTCRRWRMDRKRLVGGEREVPRTSGGGVMRRRAGGRRAWDAHRVLAGDREAQLCLLGDDWSLLGARRQGGGRPDFRAQLGISTGELKCQLPFCRQRVGDPPAFACEGTPDAGMGLSGFEFPINPTCPKPKRPVADAGANRIDHAGV